MTTTKLTRICFLKVTDNASKLQKLCAIIHNHFIKNDKVLIVVSSNEAATYIDQLLWRMPEESFTPHAIIHASTKELVAITTSHLNINQAPVLVNLLTTLHPDPGPVDVIYELLDLTSSEKEIISRKKQIEYQTAGYLIEEI